MPSSSQYWSRKSVLYSVIWSAWLNAPSHWSVICDVFSVESEHTVAVISPYYNGKIGTPTRSSWPNNLTSDLPKIISEFHSIISLPRYVGYLDGEERKKLRHCNVNLHPVAISEAEKKVNYCTLFIDTKKGKHKNQGCIQSTVSLLGFIIELTVVFIPDGRWHVVCRQCSSCGKWNV